MDFLVELLFELFGDILLKALWYLLKILTSPLFYVTGFACLFVFNYFRTRKIKPVYDCLVQSGVVIWICVLALGGILYIASL